MEAAAAQLRDALDPLNLDALGALLDDNVRWGGEDDTPDTCHIRRAVMNRLDQQQRAGLLTSVLEVTPGEHGILVALEVRQPAHAGMTMTMSGRCIKHSRCAISASSIFVEGRTAIRPRGARV
jgi:hypothetical protein